jgi:exonuclease VII large subunit
MEEHRLQLLENGALLKALGVRGRKEEKKGMFRTGELYYLPSSPNTIGVIKLGSLR